MKSIWKFESSSFSKSAGWKSFEVTPILETSTFVFNSSSILKSSSEALSGSFLFSSFLSTSILISCLGLNSGTLTSSTNLLTWALSCTYGSPIVEAIRFAQA